MGLQGLWADLSRKLPLALLQVARLLQGDGIRETGKTELMRLPGLTSR